MVLVLSSALTVRFLRVSRPHFPAGFSVVFDREVPMEARKTNEKEKTVGTLVTLR